ncbi:uncharacterized protein G2W53_015019 [Senna tora]|uniref:Uncharacterized protein n=1 Tax=Senna tora TaxID=362788 RepID=A0A834WUI2_9FABA|nr:uncharacterized protein G2W53_015019 [Senna tora]
MIHDHRTDLSAPSSCCIRSLGAVVSLEQILSEKTQKCFGRVKEKKPSPPRKRKCLVWRCEWIGRLEICRRNLWLQSQNFEIEIVLWNVENQQ